MIRYARKTGRLWVVGVLVGFLASGPGSSVLAQGAPAPASPKGQGSFPEQFARELERARRQVETLYVVRLTETLGLTPEQSAQVTAVIRKAQDTRRGLMDERRQILQDLNGLLATGAGGERIKAKVLQWEQNEARVGKWRPQLLQELAKLLSIEQQGRYLLFDENFSEHVRNAVLDIRRTQGATE